ncbi:MAG: hypothetical protein K2X29_04685 [Candidatus Obscuribacterales bacterium]|nr:hypothetical protein [Candidatus Obscuribacterales bacterium]
MKLPILLASIVLVIGVQHDASAVDPEQSVTEQRHDLPPGVHPMCRSKLGWEQIIAEMNLRIVKDPNDAEAYCRRGSAYSHFDQSELSLKDLSKAIQLKPDYASAYLERGNTYSICLSDYKHAIEDYTSAIRVDPMKCDAYHNRSLSYEVLGEHEQAEQDMLKSQEILARLRALGIEPMPPGKALPTTQTPRE